MPGSADVPVDRIWSAVVSAALDHNEWDVRTIFA